MSCNDDDVDALPALARGDTWVFDLELTAGDAPEDLTGATIWVTLKSALTLTDSQAELNYQFPVPAGADATAGLVVVRVPSDITAPVPAGRYTLGLRRVFPGPPADVWSFFRQRGFEVLQAVGGVDL